MKKTLVALPTSLEGVIRHLPVLEALSASGRHLLALVEPELAALLRFTRVPVDPVPRLADADQLQAIVSAAGCEEAVILNGRLDDAWLVRAVSIPHGWTYRTLPLGGWPVHHRVPRPSRRQRARRSATEDSRELLAAMEVPWHTSVPRLTIDDERRATAQQRLERAHIRPDERPLIGLYPGIVGGGGGRPWPRVRFEELARQLRRRQPKTHRQPKTDRQSQTQCVILATTQDLWRAVRLHEETGKIHPVIGPDLSIDDLAALLAELDLVVAAASSMLDLAAAVGTPTVGLHPRDPPRWAPPGKRHVALHVGKAGTLGAIQVSEVLDVLTFRP